MLTVLLVHTQLLYKVTFTRKSATPKIVLISYCNSVQTLFHTV